MKIKKKLCDLSKKEIKKFGHEIREIVKSPEYYCEKCVRVSSHKKFLCSPQKINL